MYAGHGCNPLKGMVLSKGNGQPPRLCQAMAGNTKVHSACYQLLGVHGRGISRYEPTLADGKNSMLSADGFSP